MPLLAGEVSAAGGISRRPERWCAPVYFCDFHSAWQRGLDENTNGLLRDYFRMGAPT